MGCWWTQNESWHFPALWLRERREGGAGVRSGLMGHPFTRLIECLLSASSDLFYSPFLPLRFLCSSISFMPHPSLPPFLPSFLPSSFSNRSSLFFGFLWQRTHLSPAWILQLTPTLDTTAVTCCFLSAPDVRLWGNSVVFSERQINSQNPEEIDFSVRFLSSFLLHFTFFPLCPLLSFSTVSSLSPFGFQPVSQSSLSTLFSRTVIKPHFPSSSGLSVLAHKGTDMTCIFHTLFPIVLFFVCVSSFRISKHWTSPILERNTVL